MDFLMLTAAILFVLTLLLLVPAVGRRRQDVKKSAKKTQGDSNTSNAELSNEEIAAGGRRALEKLLQAPDSPPPPMTEEPTPDTELEEQFSKHGHAYLDEVRFDGGSANLRPESYPILKRTAKLLENEPGLRMLVQGGSNGNINLAARRAASVARYLESRGIAGHRLETDGVVAGTGRRTSMEQIMRNRRVRIVRL